MGKIVLLVTIFMSVCLAGFSQAQTVTGSVKDGSGNPVPFATISEKGTQNAVSADAQGNFSISVKKNASLEITAAGFDPQTAAITSTPVEIVLTSGKSQTIQEVVVTAMGI